MKSLTKFLLKNSLFIHYITVVVIALGGYSLSKMRREARPSVDFDRIAVSLGYNGASATDIEELILKPVEDKIVEIDGIEEFRSSAFEGIGAISIKLDPDYSEKAGVIDEVQRAVDQAVIPVDALDPVVLEIKASKINVYSFALMGDVGPLALRAEAKRLEDDLKDLEGVSSVSTDGLNEIEYRVEVEPSVLNEKSLSLTEIMRSLKNWNKVSPAGEVDIDGMNYGIRIDEQLKTKEDIEDLTIRANDAGLGIKIKDVGVVSLQNQELKQESLVNGKMGVGFSVYKNESADIVTVVKGVKEFLKDYELKEGVAVVPYYDDAIRIENSLRTVFLNAAFGLFLVLVSLMIFVSTRLAFITAIGMPIAFLGGVAVLYALGMTLNSLVVLGMIVVLGMLVDDAIVVAENIYSHIEKGEEPAQAAIKGVSEVAAPVLATVLTTVFAFLPVVYMEGVMGQFLKVIPITVIFILLFSLFEALIILPSHCAEILKKKESEEVADGLIERLRDKYLKYVRWSIKNALSCSIMVFSFVVLVVGTVFAAKAVKFELFPRSGVEYLDINAEFPINTEKEKSKQLAKNLYQALEASEVSKDIFAMSTSIGSASKGGVSGSREQGSHLSKTTLRLTDDPGFVYREDEVVKKIKEIVKEISETSGAKITASVPRRGPPVDNDIQLLITSDNFDQSKLASDEIVEFLTKQKGNLNIQSDLMNQMKYYRVKIDKALAVESGFQFSEISSSIFSAFYGVAATKTRVGDDEVDIVVSLDKKSRTDLRSLNEMMFPNQSGSLIPLKSFAEIKMESTAPSIQRLDGKRAISVFGDVDGKVTSTAAANALLKSKLKEIKKKYPYVKFEVGGADSQRMETLRETGGLYLFSLLAIFIVISLSFNSMGFPFLVLFAIPFGVIGVVWALFLHSTPLSLMGIVGIIGLSGVVVNGSIILIQFLLEEIRRGVGLKTGIENAVFRRFRPIVITSVTTLLGLAPTIYSAGGKDTFIQPLALSLGWGLLVSTLLTLFLLPSFIYMLSVKFVK
ncbi:MAG: efflux RND transporter permease subunit [Bdellovibrionales bacterium]